MEQALPDGSDRDGRSHCSRRRSVPDIGSRQIGGGARCRITIIGNAHTRHLAARQLAKLGGQAKDAFRNSPSAQDSDKAVRHYAAKTLAEVGIDADRRPQR